MISLMLDNVSKACNVTELIELCDHMHSKYANSSICVYFSEFNKSDKTKLKKKNYENLTLIKVDKTVSSEEVVKDFVINQCSGDALFIRRAVQKYSINDVDEMIQKHEQGFQIVTIKPIKYESFWHKTLALLKNFLYKIVYNFELFEGSNQMILLDATIINSMKQSKSKIIRMSKIDNFRFVNRASVLSKSFEIKEKYKSKPHSVRFFTTLGLLITISSIYALLIAFVPSLNVVLFHIGFCIVILSLLVFLFGYGVSFVLYKSVGTLFDIELNFKKEIL